MSLALMVPAVFAAIIGIKASVGAAMPADRVQTAASTSSGKVFMTGGFNGPFSNGNTLLPVEMYDAATRQWIAKTGLPAATKAQGSHAAPLNAAGRPIGAGRMVATQSRFRAGVRR